MGAGLSLRPGRPARPLGLAGRPDAGGRWSLLPARETDPTIRAHATAAQLLDRHGVLTRAVAPSEGLGGRFGSVYRVLSALEQAGQVRRGYFVEHLGGSQFALPGAVDQIREAARTLDSDVPEARDQAPATIVLAATDPANPYGAALGWPETPTGAHGTGHRPGRKAGALVVLVAGSLVLYVERGGRTVLSFTADTAQLRAAAHGLARLGRSGRLGRLTLQRLDGVDVLDRATLQTPAALALAGAGFGTTPRGLRLGLGEER
jgi:ATP-dependent Lhr-like helicase